MIKQIFKLSALLLILFSACATLQGQVHWQLGLYAQYEVDIGSRPLQLAGLSPGAKIGATLDIPEGLVNMYLTTRWERLRENSIEIFWFNFETRESLKQDNLVIGPGLEFVFFSRRRMHLLLGLEVYLGVPLRTHYELFGSGTSTIITFPSHLIVEGGALYMAGWQTHVGLEGSITDHQFWQLRFGLGDSAQYYDWGGEAEVAGNGLLHGGRYAFASLGVSHTFQQKNKRN